MHDPDVQVFTIKRPPARRDQFGRWWPTLLTVWHHEPKGRDAGTTCSYRAHWRHPWHWRIQFDALQLLRRRLLTRCTWCGGKSTSGDAVNCSFQWGRQQAPWWRGESGLYHHDCSSIANAHASCTCEDPICEDYSEQHGPYGKCARCAKTRPFGRTPENFAVMREFAAIPVGARRDYAR